MHNMKPVIMSFMVAVVIISILYAVQGVAMHDQVLVEEQAFHELQSSYWSVDKATRDAAPTNSELNEKLVDIQNFPSELLRLKLVGVGKILTGIFILLLGILIALMIMPMRLGMIIKKDKMKGKKM